MCSLGFWRCVVKYIHKYWWRDRRRMGSLPYNNSYKDKGHECKYLLVSCMDFRFHKYLVQSLELLLGEEHPSFDFRGVVGGSRAVLDILARRQLIKSIKLAINKHGISNLILADHADCGAYGGSSKFSNSNKEMEFHFAQLKAAKKILKRFFPDLRIILLYQDWEEFRILE